ncbi:MAG TPA: oligosaccharide flippase family protein [Bacteroidia bacterium]|nr:oligosaccharide flippase family protein [Bacteroidia bacterium]
MSGNPLKKLAGQTAMYGLPTIVGRLLNYALVPYLTHIFAPEAYGTVTAFYAYMSFLNVFFTYGMETGLFNFSVRESNKDLVYSTALRSIFVSTILLVLPVILFSDKIADLVLFPGHGDLVLWVILIVATDALTAIPFAKLREQNKPKRFATIKIINIIINLAMNFFFFGLCKHAFENSPDSFFGNLYNPGIGIGYTFVAQLIANVASVLLLLPELSRIRYGFDKTILKKMLHYSLPLLVVGLAGMTNETMDRILLKYILPKGIADTQVGIYGACYKIAILMTIFTQAFKYAAEPFFFSHQKEKDAHKLYGKVMNVFVIFGLLIFLGTTLNISWIKHFVGNEYWPGLPVVPILLLANLFLGMFFNLSIWYKLTGRTRFGMWLTLFGAAITLVLNLLWIPLSNSFYGGYMGSAWATLICYGAMMVISYFIGQKYYRVEYDVLRILAYLGFAIGLFFIGTYIDTHSKILDLVLKNALIFAYLLVVMIIEKPLKMLRKSAIEKPQNT